MMGVRYTICHQAINRTDPQNSLSTTLDVPLQRPHWQGVLGRSFVLLYTMCRGQCWWVFCMAWWQFGSRCLTWDLVETSPLVSGDLCNLRRRPGSRNCPDSRLLSDLLGGRMFLPECWSRLLPCSQRRSEPGIAVQSSSRFAWGKRQCPLSDGKRSQTTWWYDHPWKTWEPREFFPVHCRTVLGLGVCRESRSLRMRGCCDVLHWSLEKRRV